MNRIHIVCIAGFTSFMVSGINAMEVYQQSPYELHVLMKNIACLDENARENKLKEVATHDARIMNRYKIDKTYHSLPINERWQYIKDKNADLAENILITARNRMAYCGSDEYAHSSKVVSDELQRRTRASKNTVRRHAYK